MQMKQLYIVKIYELLYSISYEAFLILHVTAKEQMEILNVGNKYSHIAATFLFSQYTNLEKRRY